MEEMLLNGYELLCTLLPAALLCLYVSCRGRDTGLPAMTGRQLAGLALLGAYMAAVFHVTGAGTIFDALSYGVRAGGGEVNLIPFSQEIDMLGYALNVAMTAPLGFLLPQLWPELRRPARTAAAGFAVSLCIELSQLCNHRSTDVDDLLLNTLGALAGYAAFVLLSRVIKLGNKSPAVGAWAYLGALFAGHFLLFAELLVAGRLYGF